MSPTTIKWIDKQIGHPLCALLTLWRKVFSSRKAKYTIPKSILFIKLIEQGATVLAQQAIHKAISEVGKQNTYFILFDENRPILDYIELIPPENIISIRSSSILIFLQDIFQALVRIRQARIEATIDLEFFTRATAIFAYLCGAKVRVGLHRFTSEQPYRGDLLTHRVIYNPYMHMSQHYGLLLEYAFRPAMEAPGPKISWRPLPEPNRAKTPQPHLDSIKRKLTEALPSFNEGHPLLLFHPNAEDKLRLRKWPTERYGDLALMLLQRYPDAVILLTGSQEEWPAMEKLRLLDTRHIANLAGKTSFQEFLALMDLSDVLISNDSGPTHFAALKDIGIVCLFGPETPELFAPLGQKTKVLYNRLSCSPCLSILNHRFSVCTDNLCMQGIRVDQVYEEVCDLLENDR